MAGVTSRPVWEDHGVQQSGELSTHPPDHKRCVLVIPSRLAATRLPGKPLLELAGRPLVVHVADRCAQVRGVDGVVVATPDLEIAEVVQTYGHRAVLTDDAPTGTHRVALANEVLQADLVVNVQGDQPLIDGHDIEALVQALRSGASIVTGRAPLHWEGRHRDEVVKVYCEGRRAVDFDRAWREGAGRHIGLYGFTREALQAAVSAPPSVRAQALSLEQLAWLDAGLEMEIVDLPGPAPAIDTPEQLDAMRRSWPVALITPPLPSHSAL